MFNQSIRQLKKMLKTNFTSFINI